MERKKDTNPAQFFPMKLIWMSVQLSPLCQLKSNKSSGLHKYLREASGGFIRVCLHDTGWCLQTGYNYICLIYWDTSFSAGVCWSSNIFLCFTAHPKLENRIQETDNNAGPSALKKLCCTCSDNEQTGFILNKTHISWILGCNVLNACVYAWKKVKNANKSAVTGKRKPALFQF